LLREKMSPGRMASKISKEIADVGDFLFTVPKQTRRIMNKVLRNELMLKHSISGLDKLIKDMDRSSNRIAFAVVLGAIILSSAIMHAMGTGPMVYGFSALGVITFGGAVILGIWLLISIIRSGRL
jgi:ubiquinone biosynthesis protein